jgi:hypothetical protein
LIFEKVTLKYQLADASTLAAWSIRAMVAAKMLCSRKGTSIRRNCELDLLVNLALRFTTVPFHLQMRAQLSQPELAKSLGTKFEHPLALLVEAATYAEQTSGDLWEYAIEIRELQKLGLTENDLRFLVRLDYVDHASEVRLLGNDGRRFKPTGNLYFTKQTCFVLKESAVSAFARRSDTLEARDTIGPSIIRLPNACKHTDGLRVPRWDAKQRVLSFDGLVVKQFRWHAPNQEMILSVFQEEGWPMRIDDPLAPSPTLEVERQLSDTIKCLNRKQKNNLIHFRGDGTGQGVLWEAKTQHRSSA